MVVLMSGYDGNEEKVWWYGLATGCPVLKSGYGGTAGELQVGFATLPRRAEKEASRMGREPNFQVLPGMLPVMEAAMCCVKVSSYPLPGTERALSPYAIRGTDLLYPALILLITGTDGVDDNPHGAASERQDVSGTDAGCAEWDLAAGDCDDVGHGYQRPARLL
eukprot:2722681-Rhodomonas_salina.3